jgi:hypothetical protein
MGASLRMGCTPARGGGVFLIYGACFVGEAVREAGWALTFAPDSFSDCFSVWLPCVSL